jgi:hypothetical protein
MGKFNIGDKVLSLKHGWGEIVSIYQDTALVVFIIGKGPYWFNMEGKEADSDQFQTLLTSEEAGALGLKEPKTLVKKEMRLYRMRHKTEGWLTYKDYYCYASATEDVSKTSNDFMLLKFVATWEEES